MGDAQTSPVPWTATRCSAPFMFIFDSTAKQPHFFILICVLERTFPRLLKEEAGYPCALRDVFLKKMGLFTLPYHSDTPVDLR